MTPCDKPWRKGPGPAGGAETVDDLYARGDANEQRLAACGAKVDGVRAWDAGHVVGASVKK